MKKTITLFLLCCIIQLNATAQAKSVDRVSIVVGDMNTAVDFYSRVLHFEKVADDYYVGEEWEKLYGVFGLHVRKVEMQVGDERIELIDYLTPGGRNIPSDSKSNDLWFQHIAIVVSDIDSAYKILKAHNVQHVSTQPQTLPATIPEAAGIKAFYFRDPDNHNLEIIYFPPGKGQHKWQNRTNKIFLGIDHTAIGVSNTNVSHLFYNELLGLDRKGESYNVGTEQAHLNNVKDASLHITGYRTNSGVGVEFLQYLYPGAGRRYPTDSRSDDLWQWITHIEVNDARNLYSRLLSASGYRMVSDQLVTLSAGPGARYSFIVRDPDGHAIQISSTN